jgi:2,4-dienoyl-CoA reductase-like NADH-dependent reductase (Old Yellow Enzyme family)/pyruvate/2-oxoglutarate dehydrogenase complex dihydrolipoamide dehydrogenase (E3) component
MPTVNDPIKIGNLELPNRLILAPTVKNHASEHGYMNDRVIRGFVEEARGGWGLLQCSASFIHPEGCIFRNEIGIHDDRCITGLERLAYGIHREGTLCSIQLIHGGAICDSKITGLPVVGASGKGGIFGPVRRLETDEVEERAQYYADAAVRGKDAGFDAVNIHSCQGTLIQQFMSPYTNDRDDKWGKDPGLFPETIAKKVREAVGPDFPVIWRLAAHEFMGEWLGEPGYTEEWGKKMAKRLEPYVDCFDVTGGRIGFTAMFSFPPVYAERATRVHLATEIKSVTKKPVIGVAKIMDDKLAKEVVESGRADMAQFCRPAIADPHLARKILENRPEDIRKCISCNWCLETLFRQRVVLCAVNPFYSREGEYELKPTSKPKKVMVIGGGVSGMEAAITLAQRGHKVDLYEKDEELGGLVQFVASAHPRLNTRDLRNIVDYHVAQVEKVQGLTLHLETEVTPELVEKEKPEAIIVAIGSEEAIPDIPGINSDKVVSNEDYLRSEGSVNMGKKVVVIGGNYGAETAVSLAREGKEVTMVEESDTTIRPIYIQDLYSRTFNLERLAQEAKVKIMKNTKVVEITGAGVVVENAEGKKSLECDKVLLAYNRKPKRGLYEKIKNKAPEVYASGDCVRPLDIFHAIDDAAYYARKI